VPEENNPQTKKQKRQTTAEERKVKASLKKQLARAETGVQKLEARKMELQHALAAPELYEGANADLLELQMQYAETENDLAAAEEAWVDLQEQWEQL